MLSPETKIRAAVASFVMLTAGICVNLFLLQPPGAKMLTDAGRPNGTQQGEETALNATPDAQRERLRLAEEPRSATRRERRLAGLRGGGSDTLSDADRAFSFDRSRAAEREAELLEPGPLVPEEKIASPALVRDIQQQLVARNYQPGPVDGILGVMTQAAIMAFQFDNKLPITGQPSELLLKRIIFGSNYVILRPEEKRASRVTAVRITRSVQKVLGDLGYAPGRANGIQHADLRNAIREFEADRKLIRTGRISGRLVLEITKTTGVALR